MAKEKDNDFCSGPILGKIVRFTIPIILSGLLQLFFNAMDMVVVGRYSGKTALAAVGSTGSVTNLMTNLFLGISGGAGILVSHAIGAGKKKELGEIIHTSILAGLISGIIVGIIGFFLSPVLLKAMDSPADVIGQATLYLKIIFVGMPANMVYNFGASMLRAAGDSKKPLYYLSAAGVLNIILNLFFVIVMRLDVAGVATATIISQTLSAVLVIINMAKGNEYFKLSVKELKISREKLSKIIKIGLPAGVQGSLFSISNVLIQASINSFGSVAVAGNSAAANIEGFVYIAMNSLYQTQMTFAGQNMGAKKYKRITKIMFINLGIVSALGIILGNGVYIFGRELLGIYCPSDLVSIDFGLKRLAIIGRFYFLCGLMEVMTGTLRGMGYSFISMLISIFGVCILRVVWIYTLFAEVRTLTCLYCSYHASWIIVTVIEVIIYFIIIEKLKKNKNISVI